MARSYYNYLIIYEDGTTIVVNEQTVLDVAENHYRDDVHSIMRLN